MLNSKISPIEDKEIKSFLKREDLNFKVTMDKNEVYEGASFIVIATPTNYDEKANYFNS